MDESSISPKAVAGSAGAGVGTALAAVFWIIAVNTFWEDTFTQDELTYLISGTGVVLGALFAFIGAYLTRDPLRGSGGSIPPAVE